MFLVKLFCALRAAFMEPPGMGVKWQFAPKGNAGEKWCAVEVSNL
jgi:hypothetical protein